MDTQSIMQSSVLQSVGQPQQKMPVQGAEQTNPQQSAGMDRVEISRQARALNEKQAADRNTRTEQVNGVKSSQAATIQEQSEAARSEQSTTRAAENQTGRTPNSQSEENREEGQGKTDRETVRNPPPPTGNTQNGARSASLQTRTEQLQTSDMEQMEKSTMQLAQKQGNVWTRPVGSFINQMA